MGNGSKDIVLNIANQAAQIIASLFFNNKGGTTSNEGFLDFHHANRTLKTNGNHTNVVLHANLYVDLHEDVRTSVHDNNNVNHYTTNSNIQNVNEDVQIGSKANNVTGFPEVSWINFPYRVPVYAKDTSNLEQDIDVYMKVCPY